MNSSRMHSQGERSRNAESPHELSHTPSRLGPCVGRDSKFTRLTIGQSFFIVPLEATTVSPPAGVHLSPGNLVPGKPRMAGTSFEYSFTPEAFMLLSLGVLIICLRVTLNATSRGIRGLEWDDYCMLLVMVVPFHYLLAMTNSPKDSIHSRDRHCLRAGSFLGRLGEQRNDGRTTETTGSTIIRILPQSQRIKDTAHQMGSLYPDALAVQALCLLLLLKTYVSAKSHCADWKYSC